MINKPDPSLIGSEVPDPFDLDALRIDPAAGGLGSVRRIVTHIPVRKPGRQQFVRVHPEIELPIELLTLKDEGESYLITPELRGALAEETTLVTLHLAITPQGVLSIWPVVIPGDPPNAWHSSAVEAANYARESWIKLSSDRHLGAYRVLQAQGQLPEPVWPEELGETPQQMMQAAIRIAFRDRLIDNWDHPVLKRLRGEAL
jgi:hypothetical protein